MGGAPKGVFQVLWEMGFINPDCVDSYTMHGTTDDEGNVDVEYSMLYLIESCLDFALEISQLQYMGLELGVEVHITPKFHAELAGEGVKYSWGLAKGHYRCQPLCLKRTRNNFKELVQASIATIIITTVQTRPLGIHIMSTASTLAVISKCFVRCHCIDRGKVPN